MTSPGQGRRPLPLTVSGEVLIERYPLHSRRITFRHPLRGERMTVEAPLPPDMERAMKALRDRDR